MDDLDGPTRAISDDPGVGDFEAWYRNSYPRLLDTLTVLLRDADEAREVGAEACARCLGRWDSGRRPDDPTAWTFRVAINAAHRRRRRGKVERDVIAAGARPAPATMSAPAIELWRAVGELPPRQREAVVLRYVGDLSEAQTAQAMGVAPGTAAATLSTVLRARSLADSISRRTMMTTLEERFAELSPTNATPPPTIEDLRTRVARRRRHRIALGTTAVAILVLLAAVGIALASRRSNESGLSTVDQPTTTIPVVTSAKLSATYVPPGFVLVDAGPPNQSLRISVGSPNQTEHVQSGPRNLDSVSYEGSGQLPGGQLVTAGASTQADYPSSYLDQILTSTHWSHADLGGREVSFSHQQQKVVTYFAWFAERGVMVSVMSNGLNQDEFLRFVAGLQVELPR